jgi:hypothetical protein
VSRDFWNAMWWPNGIREAGLRILDIQTSAKSLNRAIEMRRRENRLPDEMGKWDLVQGSFGGL